MSKSNPSTMSRDEALSEIKKLEKEILVLRRTAAKNSQNNSPGLREIFGGLGFILGISGLLAFMSVRKNNKINCETTSNKKDSGFNGIAGVFLAISLLIPPSVTAHFGVVLPSSNIVTPTNREITFTLAFCHPFEQVGMELIKPESFKSYFNGNETMLVNNLMETTFLKHRSWSVPFRPSRPGVYQFVMTPKPYWEEGEDCFIIHYTKTITAAFGVEEGWDKALGLPVEIVARTRPFGNYKGSSFTGQVLKDGTPLPDATVEVEYFNEGNRFMPKSMFHITQSIKSDPNGIFTINCPQAGWWSMAALTEGPTRIDSPEGPKNVEIGGILWIKVDEW
jgi:cobalt/nickel transport protein